MNEADIRKYASLMEELGLSALEIKDEGLSVRMEKDRQQQIAAKPEAPAKPREKGKLITSPMVGIFYRASAENADPYVEAGSRVRKGDTLCIIESMKLMNEIKAEEDGIIAEILAANGTVVGFGDSLFRMESDE